MSERTVTLHGNPLELAGTPIGVGDAAPDVELMDNGLDPVKLSSLEGRIGVLLSVPSLDTPVCDIETRRFNTEAVALGDAVAVVAVSADLPFAQARWCGAAGVENVQTLSDYREAAFGEAYGVLIPGLRLLARAVFVVDREGIVQYVQIVPEVADEPDYAAALAAVKALL
ncbi:thiol peroxidase [bacterium]|nr:thiol peroxidase [bacterium]